MSNDEIINELSEARKKEDWKIIDNLIKKLECESCEGCSFRRNHISEMRDPVLTKIEKTRLSGFKNVKTGIISIPVRGKKDSMKLSNLDTYRRIRRQVKQNKLITSKIESNGDRLGK